jgi:hypothetical protein
MSEHSPRQLTGSERLQRRITLADLLTGAAVALWLIPIAFVILNVPHDALVLVVVLASTLALSTFFVSVALRTRRIDRRWRDKADSTAQRRHNELAAQLANSHMVLSRMIDRAQSDVLDRVRRIEGQLDRTSWDIYADGMADARGGPEVVNAQDTRRIPPHQRPGVSNVVQFPHASNPSSNGGGF